VLTNDGAGARDEGFTLIELLVVIIIIGILAAIAIPTYLSTRQRGYEASMKSDLRSIANEESSYYVDNGQYADNSVVTITAPNGLSGGQVVIFPGTAIAMSPFNIIDLAQAGVNGFCLKITSNHYPGKVWYYDTFGGGVTKTDCTSKTGY